MSSGYVILEGNIGVGKSTFAVALTEALNSLNQNCETILEPDESNNEFLPKYYSDPSHYAYQMQMHLLSARYIQTQYCQWKALSNHGWSIMDRSYFGDLCFANLQKRDGFFSSFEYNSYVTMHKSLQSAINFPTCAIFLKADEKTIRSRINKRLSEKEGRVCESGITDKYLLGLQAEIDELQKFLSTHTRVIEIEYSANLTPEEIKEKAMEVAKKLLESAPKINPFNPWGACYLT